MAFFTCRISMVGFYKIKLRKDMVISASVKHDDADKDDQSPSIRLALLVKYEGIDGTLRNHGITLDDMPDMISCFMSGRSYKDLELKLIEVGPKRLRFFVTVKGFGEETFAIALPFSGTTGSLDISDRGNNEVYELKWRKGQLSDIHQTFRFTRKCFQFHLGGRGDTMDDDVDFSDAMVTVTEETPIDPVPHFDDD